MDIWAVKLQSPTVFQSFLIIIYILFISSATEVSGSPRNCVVKSCDIWQTGRGSCQEAKAQIWRRLAKGWRCSKQMKMLIWIGISCLSCLTESHEILPDLKFFLFCCRGSGSRNNRMWMNMDEELKAAVLSFRRTSKAFLERPRLVWCFLVWSAHFVAKVQTMLKTVLLL